MRSKEGVHNGGLVPIVIDRIDRGSRPNSANVISRGVGTAALFFGGLGGLPSFIKIASVSEGYYAKAAI